MTQRANDMESARRVEEDLGYVRDVVSRSEASDTPRAIWYLWAAIGLVGFSLADFIPRQVWLYWAIAAPLGFVLSAYLGYRHGRTIGQESRTRGRRHMLHWGGMLVAIFLVPLLAQTGSLTGEGVGQVIVLIVALGYWLAGVHALPALKWVGLLAVMAYLLTLYVDAYAWTMAGVILAIGLIVIGRAPPIAEGREPASG